MTTYIWSATADGNASTTTNWTPNGLPGAADRVEFHNDYSAHSCTFDVPEVAIMDIGTDAQSFHWVDASHQANVTLAQATRIQELYLRNGGAYAPALQFYFTQPYELSCTWIIQRAGNWNMNADVKFDDALPWIGYHLTFGDNSYGYVFANNGTASAPRKFYSAAVGKPSVPVKTYWNDDPTQFRTFDTKFLRWEKAMAFLGNDTNKVWFNTGDSTTAGLIHRATPVVREPKLDVHYIEGRAMGRVWKEGGNAGICSIAGRLPTYSFAWQTILDMMDSTDTVAFQFDTITIPRAYIESFRPEPKPGSLYQDFSLVLIEAQ